jgi:hypothetical protein
MPRYLFSLQNGEVHADPEGEVLANDEEARNLGKLVAKELRQGRSDYERLSVVVRREGGSEVARVRLKDIKT